MKYFVTGATGFIGGEVVRQLIAAGHTVVAVVRSPEKAQALTNLGVEIHQGDITDKASLRAPMTGADGVFHIAAWYKLGARDTSVAEKINVQGTRNVLELMQELNIPKGVYTSTVAVFSDTRGKVVDETYQFSGKHISEYDRTKWAAHYEVALPMIKAGLPLVIVLPGAVYGPGDTSLIGETFTQYLKGKLPMLPKQTTFCWSHVEDTARGHLLAMEKGTPGESYIIAGPCHTFEATFEIAATITDIPAPRLRIPPAAIKSMAALMGVIGKVVPLPPTYTAETLRVTAGATYTASNAKARRDLGFDPRPLDEGLRPTLLAEMERLGIQKK